MKISIIVPIFNVEKYIHTCLESLINQTYKDFEIILIDDGSFDDCPAICDNYAKRNNNIKVIHQQNAGVSSARNRGIDIASGDYVMFVDSDDYVFPTLCENLIKYADEKTDIVISGFVEGFSNKQQIVQVEDVVCYAVDDLKRNFDFYYLRLPLLNSPCAKLYKRCLLNDIRFKSEICMGEDFIFNLKYFNNSRNIKIIPFADYYYNLTNAESATKKYKEEYFACYIKCYEAGKKFKYGEVGFSNDALDEVLCLNSLHFVQSVERNVKNKKEKKDKILNVITTPYFHEVCCGKYNFSLHLRLMQILCKNKKYNLLRMFFALKKMLVVFKR